MSAIDTTDMDEYEAALAERCGGRDGFEVVDTPDYGGWAQVRVKTTENADTDATREWLPESDWFVFEARGEHAYERAMQAAHAYLDIRLLDDEG